MTVSNSYTIRTMRAHCHRCGRLTTVVSRVNRIRPTEVRKTDLCERCAPMEWVSNATTNDEGR